VLASGSTAPWNWRTSGTWQRLPSSVCTPPHHVRYTAGVLFHQTDLSIHTPGRSTRDLTRELGAIVHESKIDRGLCTVFVHHTSASLMICENADPQVRKDLERFLTKLVPDGDTLFDHVDEGPDDMPAHVRSILTQTSLGLPIRANRLDLGTWQGVYLYEHRRAAHTRRVSVTLIGET
jgi:secondary thiamine-phosphate synthase enzyme